MLWKSITVLCLRWSRCFILARRKTMTKGQSMLMSIGKENASQWTNLLYKFYFMFQSRGSKLTPFLFYSINIFYVHVISSYRFCLYFDFFVDDIRTYQSIIVYFIFRCTLQNLYNIPDPPLFVCLFFTLGGFLFKTVKIHQF